MKASKQKNTGWFVFGKNSTFENEREKISMALKLFEFLEQFSDTGTLL